MAGQPAESGEDEIILEEFISIDFHFLTKSYHYLTHTVQESIAKKILGSDRLAYGKVATHIHAALRVMDAR